MKKLKCIKDQNFVSKFWLKKTDIFESVAGMPFFIEIKFVSIGCILTFTLKSWSNKLNFYNQEF